MDDMVKVAALAVTAALCACVVKKQVRELGLVLALAAGALILGMAFRALSGLGMLLDSLSELAGLSPAVLSPVLKTVGCLLFSPRSPPSCAGTRGRGASPPLWRRRAPPWRCACRSRCCAPCWTR